MELRLVAAKNTNKWKLRLINLIPYKKSQKNYRCPQLHSIANKYHNEDKYGHIQ